MRTFINLNKKIGEAKELSKYAVAIRYPTEYLKLNKRETNRFIKIAKKVKSVIRELLAAENSVFK